MGTVTTFGCKAVDGGTTEEQWIIHLIYGETGMYWKSFDNLEK
jgi:hypothetical protein